MSDDRRSRVHQNTSMSRYDELRASHRWDVPARYNIARDVCDKDPPDRLAMVHEDPDGRWRGVVWAEL